MRTPPGSFINKIKLFMKPYVTLAMYKQAKWLKVIGEAWI